MNSSDLNKRRFGAWEAFTLAREQMLLRDLPTVPGVYSMRLSKAEARLRGSSDIAYIGKATNRNGVQGRIRQYFHPGWRQSTNLEMKARLVSGIVLELAYIKTRDVGEAGYATFRIRSSSPTKDVLRGEWKGPWRDPY